MSAFKILISSFIILVCSNVLAQNLKGVKEYTLLVSYSDESEKFKKYLPSSSDIKTKISWSVPELKYATRIGEYNYALITISYNYYRNYEETYNIQYYGTINVRVYRYAIIRGSEDVVNAQVFWDETYFTMVNPTYDMIKQEAEQTISHLITSFGKLYYEDN